MYAWVLVERKGEGRKVQKSKRKKRACILVLLLLSTKNELKHRWSKLFLEHLYREWARLEQLHSRVLMAERPKDRLIFT